MNHGNQWRQLPTWYGSEDSQSLLDICLQEWESCGIIISNDLVPTATLLLCVVNLVSDASPRIGMANEMVYEAPIEIKSVISEMSPM